MSYGESLAALRGYVTAGEEPSFKAPPGQVRLDVTHDILGTSNSRNFPLEMLIGSVKDKLQQSVGTSPIFMKLR